ncbi:MAG TPA: hypothetical protein VML54_14770, partial [Candidatus Limnocylindrales bacterium]|nr:hypothetical protein [Candidatus Limnocylindrales bacterium]
MSKHAAEPGAPQAHVEARRGRVIEGLERPPERVGEGEIPLARDHIDHLVHDAEELYWNELAWEELTDEERVAGGHLTELVFPGFLAFVDGLLLETRLPGVLEAPRPHPEVVEEILVFLAERYTEATAELEQGADSERIVWARSL